MTNILMLLGTIVKGIGGFYYVHTEKGVFECRARGIFRKNGIKPTVGDKVQISVLDEAHHKGSLDVIEERKNELTRPRVANVDQAVIVFAAKDPQMNLDLLDRFLILAEEQGLDILICINKTDLDLNKAYEAVAAFYRKAGYPLVLASAEEGIGLKELQCALAGKISVLAGPSGVGKSSLINSAFPEFSLETGALSLKIARGKHTTRHAELMQIAEDGFIVDSPGFTSLSLGHIHHENLHYYFREFQPYLHQCYYTGCSHTHEPNCAVKEHTGIDKEIAQARYDRYVALYLEIQKERRI